MSPKQTILNSIKTQMESIKTASGYYTNVQKVISGKLIPSAKVPPNMRASYICVLYGGQSNSPTQRAHLQQATSEYTIFASMGNVTSEQFMNFLDDIESATSKGGFLEDGNSVFTILDKYVSNISVTDSSEFDEVFSNSEEQYKDRAAVLSLVVTYLYDAKNLSGN
ncbi:MAG: hypothetical protein CL885_03000 [Dehalococcoidia bacterium]|nr:hypothetical protein [Dehalococcoidia bacterium]|tara:strand:- start:91 stop:588 length:498 start_codon:yes stop_codon:yes gene_type:complete